VGVEFGLLGPLRADRDGTPLPLGGPRQRAVLARLLLDPARVMPVGVLIDDVWGGDPPETATKTLQKYVSELRKSLGPKPRAHVRAWLLDRRRSRLGGRPTV
jgi:DNA-binding SARP family transcriptional activator